MESQTVPPPPIFHHSPVQVLAALRENRLLERLRRIARNGIKAPRQLAGLRVVGGNVSADAVLAAAVADDHSSLHDARRASDGVAQLRIDGELLPNFVAGCRIERDQASIERADIKLAFPDGDAAIHYVAAGARSPLRRDVWIVRPQTRASRGVQREDFAPRGGKIHYSIDDEGRGFLTSVCVEIEIPRKAKVAGGVVVDFVERTEALFTVSAAVSQPVSGLAVSVYDLCVGSPVDPA